MSRILQLNLLLWARGLFGNNFRFQDDNAPANPLLNNFPEEQDVNQLIQPALSLDLNLVEHLWDG
jgi:hypothetical protein